MGIFADSNNGHIVDAVAFFDSDIPKQAGELLSMGLLVAFGSTRDRGAISVQLTCDGDYVREYFRQADEASEWMARQAASVKAAGIGESNGQPPALQTPPRRRRKAL